MPITITEKHESRNRTRNLQTFESTEVMVFDAEGTNDSKAAEDSVLAFAPTTLHGGEIRRLNATTERLEKSPEIWRVTINYGVPDSELSEPGDSSFFFDTSGGQVHISQSLATRSRTGAGGAIATNHHGAIGVSSDGIEGVDIQIPTYSFGETHIVDAFTVTPAFKAALFFATGTVNSAPFRNFDTGEVIFLGARGSKRGMDAWEISVNYMASPNVVDLPVGPDIVVPFKGGWEYLWVEYEEVKDDDSNRSARRPLAAYVEQVYQMVDFNSIGL